MRRLAISMLIRAVLATAKTVRNGKILSIGRSGAPIRTTSSRMPASGFWGEAMSPDGMTATTETATSM